MKTTRLKAGKRAPFAGVLMSNEALAKLKVETDKAVALQKLKTQRCERERTIENKVADTIRNAVVGVEKAKTASCRGDLTRRVAIYEQALKQCSKDPPWYRSPTLAFVLGNVVASGVCVTGAVLGSR